MLLTQDIHPLMDYLRQHPHVGEWFTFLVAFAESLPLIGTIIPGTITMTVVGFLIGTNALPGVWALAIASFAALCGDSIGFIIGYCYNEQLRGIWPFKKHPKWLTLSEAFFEKHGGKSILIGRFVGPVRSTVPMIAGLLQLSWLRFFIAAIPSAILWAIAYVTPGVILGALSREVPQGETTKFILYGVGTLAVVWFLFWVIEHFFTQLTRGISYVVNKIWQSLNQKNCCQKFTSLITNQQAPSDYRQLTYCIGALITGVLFLILLLNVRTHGIFTIANRPVFYLLQSIHTHWLTQSMIATTLMGAPKTMLCIGTLITAAFLLRKQYRTGWHVFIGLILAAGSVMVFKHLSHSLRPQGFNIVTNSSSFPSGHTTMSFFVYGYLSFLVAEALDKTKRWIPYTLATLAIVTVGFSRLYLGAHWLTDIVGSYLLGATVIFLMVVSYRRMPNALQKITFKPITILLIVSAFLLPWIIILPMQFTKNIYRYTPVFPTKTISVDTWWNNPLNNTPRYRLNRFGHPFQPFNLQWHDNLNVINKTLLKAGWISPVKSAKLQTALRRFTSHQAQYHMPLLPWLYRNNPPVLMMIKRLPHRRTILEVRLWQSGVTFTNSKQPLYIGAINYRLPPQKLFSYAKRAEIALHFDKKLNTLLINNETDFNSKVVQTNSRRKPLSWSGYILIIRRQ